MAKWNGFHCLCINRQTVHFTTHPLKWEHPSSSHPFHNIRHCHSNLVSIRRSRPGILRLRAFHFVSLQWQNSIWHSSEWQHQAGTVTLGAYTSLKFLQKWRLTAKQNDAFNLSWKIRKVNENTQGSFRLFSEGAFRGKSWSLTSDSLPQSRGPPRAVWRGTSIQRSWWEEWWELCWTL